MQYNSDHAVSWQIVSLQIVCRTRLFAAAAIAGLAMLAVVAPLSAAGRRGRPNFGAVELDVKSKYSHIRVRRQGNVRSLVFVRDTGEEACETQMDITKPHQLRIDYVRHMFLSYLLRPKHQKVLIVGLGGGSMVQFLKHYDSEVAVEAVEIDQAVVDIAEKYFDVRSEGKVSIHTADGLKFLAETESQYDVIYMDAFLKPSRDTDSTGAPLHLKTVRFYKDLQKKIVPGGLVVFNLNAQGANTRADVTAIRNAFANTYVFPVAGHGCVVVASSSDERVPLSTLRANAKATDLRFKADFSLQSMARKVGR